MSYWTVRTQEAEPDLINRIKEAAWYEGEELASLRRDRTLLGLTSQCQILRNQV